MPFYGTVIKCAYKLNVELIMLFGLVISRINGVSKFASRI